MDEFHRRLDIASDGKSRLADEIMRLNSARTIVVDLGAGTCVLERLLAERGFEGWSYAIDRSIPEECRKIHHGTAFQNDIVRGLIDLMPDLLSHSVERGTDDIVFVLSAVIHELGEQERKDLSSLLRIACRFSNARTHLIVREAAYDPIMAYDSGIGALSVAANLGDLAPKWTEYYNLHKFEWPSDMLFANFCFAVSYGPDSWERERLEGRYSLSESKLRDFIGECGFRVASEWAERDPLYASTLPFGVYEALKYTSRGFVCHREGDAWTNRAEG